MKTTIRRASIWVFSLNMLAIVLALIISYQGGRDPFGERGYITFFFYISATRDRLAS